MRRREVRELGHLEPRVGHRDDGSRRGVAAVGRHGPPEGPGAVRIGSGDRREVPGGVVGVVGLVPPTVFVRQRFVERVVGPDLLVRQGRRRGPGEHVVAAVVRHRLVPAEGVAVLRQVARRRVVHVVDGVAVRIGLPDEVRPVERRRPRVVARVCDGRNLGRGIPAERRDVVVRVLLRADSPVGPVDVLHDLVVVLVGLREEPPVRVVRVGVGVAAHVGNRRQLAVRVPVAHVARVGKDHPRQEPLCVVLERDGAAGAVGHARAVALAVIAERDALPVRVLDRHKPPLGVERVVRAVAVDELVVGSDYRERHRSPRRGLVGAVLLLREHDLRAAP